MLWHLAVLPFVFFPTNSTLHSASPRVSSPGSLLGGERGTRAKAGRYRCPYNIVSATEGCVQNVVHAAAAAGWDGAGSDEGKQSRLRHVVAQSRPHREVAHIVLPLGIVVRSAGVLHARAVLAIQARREELIRLRAYPRSSA